MIATTTPAASRHIISVLLENEAGALSRVVGLFSARGYNIETLTVAPTEDPTLSRMTIVTGGSDDIIEQITKHLNRLIEVVKVVDLTEGQHIERELMLMKVRAVGKEREELKRTADIFRGRIIDVTDRSYTIELTGAATKLDAFIEGDRPRGDPGDGPDRRVRHRPRRTHPENLNNHNRENSMNVYYDKDADLSLIKGRKVAIIGYGSQGHAHAQNLKDSGGNVVVGLRKGGASWDKVGKAGLQVAEVADAVKDADFVMMLLPDEHIGQVYREDIEPVIKNGAALAFAHGFNIHYGQVMPRADLDVVMVAPKAPGHTVRGTYTQGGGVPMLISWNLRGRGPSRLPRRSPLLRTDDGSRRRRRPEARPGRASDARVAARPCGRANRRTRRQVRWYHPRAGRRGRRSRAFQSSSCRCLVRAPGPACRRRAAWLR